MDHSVLFDEAPVAMLGISKEGFILEVNQLAHQIFPRQKNIKGNSFNSLFDQSETNKINQIINGISKENEGRITRPLLLPSGEEIQVSFKNLGDGEIVCTLNSHTEKINASYGNLELFVQKSPRPVAMFDSEMKYIACSKTWATDWNIKAKGRNLTSSWICHKKYRCH